MQIQCLLIRAQEKHRKLSAWLLNIFLWFIIIYFLILLRGKKYQEALDDWHELWWCYAHLQYKARDRVTALVIGTF